MPTAVTTSTEYTWAAGGDASRRGHGTDHHRRRLGRAPTRSVESRGAVAARSAGSACRPTCRGDLAARRCKLAAEDQPARRGPRAGPPGLAIAVKRRPRPSANQGRADGCAAAPGRDSPLPVVAEAHEIRMLGRERELPSSSPRPPWPPPCALAARGLSLKRPNTQVLDDAPRRADAEETRRLRVSILGPETFRAGTSPPARGTAAQRGRDARALRWAGPLDDLRRRSRSSPAAQGAADHRAHVLEAEGLQ